MLLRQLSDNLHAALLLPKAVNQSPGNPVWPATA